MTVFRDLAACLAVTLLLVGLTVSAYAGETLPWGIERIHAQCIWDNNDDMVVDENATAGQNVTIAVLDTGVDYIVFENGTKYYYDLHGNIIGGRTFKYDGVQLLEYPDYSDPYGHGTHVTGTIAAVDNDEGVIGTAPKTRILALRLYSLELNVPESWKAEEVAAAINYAFQNGCAIISMSFGLIYDYPKVRAAVENAYSYGKILIASAGNDGKQNDIDYPAKYAGVIAVGAIYPNDTRWEKSDTGTELDLVAPGVNINSTFLGGSYGLLTGTSMAVPHVTGAAALIWSSKVDPDFDFMEPYGEWNRDEVLAKLFNITLDLGSPGKDDYYGWGLVNPWANCQRPLGDIDNSYAVDMVDLWLCQRAYGSYPGQARWDARADIDISNNVDMIDMWIAATNFGKIDP